MRFVTSDSLAKLNELLKSVKSPYGQVKALLCANQDAIELTVYTTFHDTIYTIRDILNSRILKELTVDKLQTRVNSQSEDLKRHIDGNKNKHK